MTSAATDASGIERIRSAFSSSDKIAALMPYLMACYPSKEQSIEIARAYIEGGADMIELGVPFSDPLADGPVIHNAATWALNGGAKISDAFEVANAVSGELPVLLMTYVNPIEARGAEPFVAAAAASGAAGLIVPDVPLEEAAELRDICRGKGLALVPLVAPTTKGKRLEEICSLADGFVYLVSVIGTTGERAGAPPDLSQMIADVKAVTDLPVAVGFGIAEPQHAREVGQFADGAIVGTRLVREVADGLQEGEDFVTRTRELVSAFSEALR